MRLVHLRLGLQGIGNTPNVHCRIGEHESTILEVKLYNEYIGDEIDISGAEIGFELRNNENKIVIDTSTTRFTKLDKDTFQYTVDDKVYSNFGSSLQAYFTLSENGKRTTTQEFTFIVSRDVQTDNDGLSSYYVSKIEELNESNQSVFEEAERIKTMIESNQVVKKIGDTMEGDLAFQVNAGTRKLPFKNGETVVTSLEVDTNGSFRMRDSVNNFNVFEYDQPLKQFNFNGSTNFVKKADTFQKFPLTQDTGAAIVLVTGYNVDNLKTAGNYVGTGMVNTPGNSPSTFSIKVTQYHDNLYAAIQIATDIKSNDQVFYYRKFINGTWNTWGKHSPDSELVSQSSPYFRKGEYFVEHVDKAGYGLRVGSNSTNNYMTVAPYSPTGTDFTKQFTFNFTTGDITSPSDTAWTEGVKNPLITSGRIAFKKKNGIVTLIIGSITNSDMNLLQPTSGARLLGTLPANASPTSPIAASIIAPTLGGGSSLTLSVRSNGEIVFYGLPANTSDAFNSMMTYAI